MAFEDLTPQERELVEAAEAPARVQVQVTNIWVVESLFDEDRQTGRELHEWGERASTGVGLLHSVSQG